MRSGDAAVKAAARGEEAPERATAVQSGASPVLDPLGVPGIAYPRRFTRALSINARPLGAVGHGQAGDLLAALPRFVGAPALGIGTARSRTLLDQLLDPQRHAAPRSDLPALRGPWSAAARMRHALVSQRREIEPELLQQPAGQRPVLQLVAQQRVRAHHLIGTQQLAVPIDDRPATVGAAGRKARLAQHLIRARIVEGILAADRPPQLQTDTGQMLRGRQGFIGRSTADQGQLRRGSVADHLYNLTNSVAPSRVRETSGAFFRQSLGNLSWAPPGWTRQPHGRAPVEDHLELVATFEARAAMDYQCGRSGWTMSISVATRAASRFDVPHRAPPACPQRRLIDLGLLSDPSVGAGGRGRALERRSISQVESSAEALTPRRSEAVP